MDADDIRKYIAGRKAVLAPQVPWWKTLPITSRFSLGMLMVVIALVSAVLAYWGNRPPEYPRLEMRRSMFKAGRKQHYADHYTLKFGPNSAQWESYKDEQLNGTANKVGAAGIINGGYFRSEVYHTPQGPIYTGHMPAECQKRFDEVRRLIAEKVDLHTLPVGSRVRRVLPPNYPSLEQFLGGKYPPREAPSPSPTP